MNAESSSASSSGSADPSAKKSSSDETKRASSKAGGKPIVKQPKFIATVVALALVVIVILQNTGSTEVKVLFWTVSLPRWILLSLVFASGAAAGVLIPRWRRRKKQRPGSPG